MSEVPPFRDGNGLSPVVVMDATSLDLGMFSISPILGRCPLSQSSWGKAGLSQK